MIECMIHPALQDMINLGCTNQFAVSLAFQVYLDLCEVQAMRDVSYLYNSELDLLYLTGTSDKNPQSDLTPDIFLPLSTVSEITPAWIHKVQNILCSGRDKKSLILAMKEHDSTIVYYRMTQGLVPPDSPETGRKKRKHEEQKHSIEVEIRRMRKELFERALNSGVMKTVLNNEEEEKDSLDVNLTFNSRENSDKEKLHSEDDKAREEDKVREENKEVGLNQTINEENKEDCSKNEEGGI